jgi:uncharacterized protein (DUF1778 family)
VPKTSQLQIRVTPQEKRQLRARAAAAGLDVSTYVLTRALPRDSDAITQIVRRIPEAAELSYVLAELHDALVSLTAAGFPAAVAHVDVGRLSAFEANYVTAMVEHSAVARGMTAPAWCRDVAPLATPYFAAPMAGLRLHLLRASPVAFKRRNLFVDSVVGARV